MKVKVFLLFIFYLQSTNEQYCSFNSAQVIRVIPKTLKHVQELAKLSKLEYVWISPIINVTIINTPTLYSARVETAQFFQNYCKKLGMDADVVVSDVQRDLIKMKPNQMNKNRQVFLDGMNPTNYQLYEYHKWNEIYSFMRSLVQRYPSICSIIDIGLTSEGKPMKLLKISSNKGNKRKSAIWIDSTIHAREWITTNIATHIMYQLVVGYERNSTMKHFVDDITWYILPILNVDGYDYSWETDRMWRKSRSKLKMCEKNSTQPICYCKGVDLNRNWDTHWNTTYTCNHPCCHIYPGASAMSEPEVKNVAEFLRKNDDHIEAYITLHNYGQLFTYPYTHTYKEYPPNYASLRELAELAADAISRKHGKHYTVGSLSDILSNPAGSGVSIDWVVENTKISFSYLIEVRPTNDIGHFCLNETEIQPTSEEIFAAIQTVANYLAGNITLTGKYTNLFSSAISLRYTLYHILYCTIIFVICFIDDRLWCY